MQSVLCVTACMVWQVIGVGGGGGNAVNRMIESVRDENSAVNAVEMWTVNTDAQVRRCDSLGLHYSAFAV